MAVAGSVYGSAQAPHSAGIHNVEEAEAMELIDDWGSRKRVPPQPGHRAPVTSLPDLAKAIHAALAGVRPPTRPSTCIATKTWDTRGRQVVFDEVIHPGVALSVGEALAAVAGDGVYFNSLQPKVVSFLLEPAFDPQPDLRASRYGASLAEIKASWSRPDESTRSRGLAGRRSGP